MIITIGIIKKYRVILLYFILINTLAADKKKIIRAKTWEDLLPNCLAGKPFCNDKG